MSDFLAKLITAYAIKHVFRRHLEWRKVRRAVRRYGYHVRRVASAHKDMGEQARRASDSLRRFHSALLGLDLT